MTSKATNAHIRIGVRTRSLAPERLQYLRQIGVDDVFVDHSSLDEEPDAFVDETDSQEHLVIDGNAIPSERELIAAREQVEAAGLRLAGIHSLPFTTYGPIMFGTSEMDERLERVATLIERLGAAEIPILGYQWNPRGLVPMRTGTETVRGGAQGTRFELSELNRPVEPSDLPRSGPFEEADFWSRYEQFLDHVLPVAEAADVRLALHPVDPPGLREIGGVPRLFRDVEAFERALSLHDSPHHGLKLCLGCFSQLGEDIPGLIRKFGTDDRIVFVHFRDVRGTMPEFTETFVDDGNFEPVAAMEALSEIGFRGAVLPDHVPEVIGDTQWRHRARGYTVGYLRGIIDAVEQRAGTEH